MLMASSGPSTEPGTQWAPADGIKFESGEQGNAHFRTHPHVAQVYFLVFMVEARIVSLYHLIHFVQRKG